jgi:hypothetical protein
MLAITGRTCLISPCRSFADHTYIDYHVYFEASGKIISTRKIVPIILFGSLEYQKYTIKLLWQKKDIVRKLALSQNFQ